MIKNILRLIQFIASKLQLTCTIKEREGEKEIEKDRISIV